MYIKEIYLNNFRNHQNKFIKFDNKLNIINGINGIGKTNILESIYLSAFSKSFKTNKDKELIKNGTNFLKTNIVFNSGNREQNIEIFLLNTGKKQIKVNGATIKSVYDLIGKINLVFFAPEDLKIVIGSPTDRRKFLDREISQIYKSYYKDLIDYNKVLIQRNNQIKIYIKTKKDKELISIWNDGLIEYGTNIIKKRNEFLSNINEVATKIHHKISSDKEKMYIKYNSTINCNNINKDDYSQILEKNLENDIYYGYTNKGIHKEDFEIFVNDLPVKLFGSQGQKRTSILSIKIAQLKVMESIIKDKSILLLDDVNSELDSLRRNILIDTIKDNQCIMTTTDVKDFAGKEDIFNNIKL